MKSALLEREQKNFMEALTLLEEGISKYKSFPKLFMIGGQICADDLPREKANLDKARKFYQRGLQECPTNATLWTLASRLEETAHTFDNPGAVKSGLGVTKARGLLEIARLKNPKNPALWLESIRLERRTGNGRLADSLMARALQECPNSGLLLAENINSAPRAEKKSKSADAIKRCPEDPLVITAVATLFASDRKKEKARKWYDRAVILDPDIGDSWAQFYAFEREHGSKEQMENVKERCIKTEPRHGELWTSVTKDMANRRKSTAEHLELAAQQLISAKNGNAGN
jgi:pre-mRNA-processing factor 6